MNPDSHAPLYGRLVHLPGRDERLTQQPRWPWLMPWVLAVAAVGITLLLAACDAPRPAAAAAPGVAADTSRP